MPGVEKQGNKGNLLEGDNLERRYLTIMFCDLVGSTSLSERLDPEDLREIIGRFRSLCAEALDQFGGYLADFMGDGILVYFGYPESYENHAERAILAGLQITRTITVLDKSPNSGVSSFAVRIGIASGLVVAGDLVSRGVRDPLAIIGQAPNLAARLQAIAEPNSLIVSNETKQLADGLFEFEDWGTPPLKGFVNGGRVWKVINDKATPNRFQALHPFDLSPLTGRDGEFLVLRERWGRAQQGEANVVLLTGEPGIGKSRLVQELLNCPDSAGATVLHYAGSPYHQDSALLPFIRQLGQSCNFVATDLPDSKLDKLDRFLLRLAKTESAPLFASLLSLPTTRYVPLDATLNLEKETTMRALVEVLIAIAETGPAIVIFEDAHWLDPSSRELLQLMIDQTRSLAILILITSRPERAPDPGVETTRIALTRLGRVHSTAMIRQIVANRVISAEALNDILEKTDGVPLFIEELTKLALDTGASEAPDANRFATPAIPATLLGSMVARLDSLGNAKEIAQVAAAIGKEFSIALLSEVLQRDEAEIQQLILPLIEAGILWKTSGVAYATHAFRHALLATAAYETLLLRRRQQLHRQIVAAVERKFPETAEAQPDLLAYHCAKGLLNAKALAYWRSAGLRAAGNGANMEAIAHLRRAIDLLPLIEEMDNVDEAELELRTALGNALVELYGFALPEAVATQERVADLCDKLGGNSTTFHAIFWLWLFDSGRGACSAARSVARRLASISGSSSDHSMISIASQASGISAFIAGSFEEARLHLDRAVEFGAGRSHRRGSGFHLTDSLPVAISYMSLTLLILGYPDGALACLHQMSDSAKTFGRRSIEVISLTNACYLHQMRRDWRAVSEKSNSVLLQVKEAQLSTFGIIATIFRGWAVASSGKQPSDLDEILKGLETMRQTGAAEELCYFYALASETFAACGQMAAALELIDNAIKIAERTGESWYLAELYRQLGALQSIDPRKERDAVISFSRALSTAQEQKARFWELRAVVSLGQHLIKKGQTMEARRLVDTVYCQFKEGFHLPDLQDARRIIDQIPL